MAITKPTIYHKETVRNYYWTYQKKLFRFTIIYFNNQIRRSHQTNCKNKWISKLPLNINFYYGIFFCIRFSKTTQLYQPLLLCIQLNILFLFCLQVFFKLKRVFRIIEIFFDVVLKFRLSDVCYHLYSRLVLEQNMYY